MFLWSLGLAVGVLLSEWVILSAAGSRTPPLTALSESARSHFQGVVKLTLYSLSTTSRTPNTRHISLFFLYLSLFHYQQTNCRT